MSHLTPTLGTRRPTGNDPVPQVPPNGTVARLLDGRGWLDLEQLGETFEEVQPWATLLQGWGWPRYFMFFQTTWGKPGAEFFPEFFGCVFGMWELGSQKLGAIGID